MVTSADKLRLKGLTPVSYRAGSLEVERIYLGRISLYVANPPSGIDLSHGLFSINGFDIGVTALSAEAGWVIIDGWPATFSSADLMESGSFTISGFDVLTSYGRSVSFDAGMFAITGFDADFEHNQTLTLEFGSFTINGFEATFEHHSSAPPEIDVYTMNFYDVFKLTRVKLTTFNTYDVFRLESIKVNTFNYYMIFKES